ncbi:hypothetical protein, partial [Salegentibacter maritimus]|uniref:hypothetical protein n=1 Tax=Salegentibacter maritimus TaxID=2794347 RepID=UPI001E40483F
RKKCNFRNQERKWLIRQVRIPTPATCDNRNRWQQALEKIRATIMYKWHLIIKHQIMKKLNLLILVIFSSAIFVGC